jgi:hypothetical protein
MKDKFKIIKRFFQRILRRTKAAIEFGIHFKIIDDPSKINAGQFSKFEKHVWIKMSQGDSIHDIPPKFARLNQFISVKDTENAIKEVSNLYALFFNILQSENLDAHALKYLVKCKDSFADEDDAYKWLMTYYTEDELTTISNNVKKKYIMNYAQSFLGDS